MYFKLLNIWKLLKILFRKEYFFNSKCLNKKQNFKNERKYYFHNENLSRIAVSTHKVSHLQFREFDIKYLFFLL